MEENVRKAIAAIEAQQEKVTERLAGARIDRNKLEQLVWAEEVADVKIMQEQMQIMFDLAGKVKGYEAAKVERLRERLGGEAHGS